MLRLLFSSSLFYLLLFFTAFIYWPGLDGGFLLDDAPNLLPLKVLDNGTATWLDLTLDNESGPLGRPVSMLTLIMNYLLNGNDPWNFKYTNLMIHLLCGVLVLWLSYRLLYETRLRDKRYVIALWVATLWLLTPLQVSTVLYVIQRMAQLSTLFVLAGLISYTAGRQALEHRPLSGILLIMATFFIWLPLAVFSKENGALLPLLALVVELYFFELPAKRWQKQFIKSLFILTVLLPALLLVLYILVKPEFITNTYISRDFTLKERLLSEVRILFIYLRSLLIPDSTSMGILHDDFNKSTGLLTPVTTLLSILTWLTVPVAAWVYRKKEWSVYFFAPIFFIAAHIMESSIFALELYFEHRNYLASYSIYLMLAYGLFDLRRRYKDHVLASAFLILFPIVHITATYQRVQVWKSTISIILNDIYWHPRSLRAHGNLAGLYIQTGEYQKALQHIDTVFMLNPLLSPEAYILRFLALCGANAEIDVSEYKAFGKALDTPRAYPPTETLRTLRSYIREGKCKALDLPSFIDVLDKWSAKQSNPANKRKMWISNIHLAQLMFDSGLKQYQFLSLKTLGRTMLLVPEYHEAGLLKVRYALILGRYDDAWEALQFVKSNDKHHRKDYSDMIQQYEDIFQDLRKRGLSLPETAHNKKPG